MILEKPEYKKTFKDFFKENIKSTFSLRPLIGFSTFFIVSLIKSGLERTLFIYSKPLVWLIILGLIFINHFVSAIYWHFHVRSPQYRKQMIKEQELAKKRAEKAVKKAIEAAKPPVNIN